MARPSFRNGFGRTESSASSEVPVVSDDVILSVRDVRVVFEGERGSARVLDDISVDIRRGEVLGLCGESGSGKSMLASALLDAVVEGGRLSGEVIYNPKDGEPFDITELSDEELRQFRWESVSMVFQGAMGSFNPVRKIKTHFIETLSAHDYAVSDGMERAHEILDDFHLDAERVMESYPHELSGGMRQRALIALSLILDPDVLVMDEPTAALDLLMQRSILSLLEDLQEKYGITLVFITHDLALIASLVDRLAVMYAFDIVEVGPIDRMLADPKHPYTRALLRASPNMTIPLEEIAPIEGQPPDPVEHIEGCAYHPRCSLATEQCRTAHPETATVAEDHDVDCYHWRDSAAAIDIHHAVTEPAASEQERHTSVRRDYTPHAGRDTRSGEPVLSLENVDVHFEVSSGVLPFLSSSETVEAVNDVSLDIYEGEVFVLLGESGCGKSTLGKTAIGVQRPTSGTVSYRGQDVWKAKSGTGDVAIPYGEIRRNLQIIHQDPESALNPRRRVRSILADPLKRWNDSLGRAERTSIIASLLGQVGMTPVEEFIERYPHELSGGEKQRIVLIRSLLTNPALVFADEPISALDVSLRVDMMNLMIELQETFGTAFLFVSHDMATARYIAGKTGGRVGVMYLGELVEVGPAEQVLSEPRHPYTKALRAATPELLGEETERELPIRTIDIPEPSDPPSGCRFHTRCEHARELCQQQLPTFELDDKSESKAACFRVDEDHDYWQSPPLY